MHRAPVKKDASRAHEDLRRRRDEMVVELRKAKRDEFLAKRRNLAQDTESENEDMDNVVSRRPLCGRYAGRPRRGCSRAFPSEGLPSPCFFPFYTFLCTLCVAAVLSRFARGRLLRPFAVGGRAAKAAEASQPENLAQTAAMLRTALLSPLLRTGPASCKPAPWLPLGDRAALVAVRRLCCLFPPKEANLASFSWPVLCGTLRNTPAVLFSPPPACSFLEACGCFWLLAMGFGSFCMGFRVHWETDL
jgi:hypothetical protein